MFQEGNAKKVHVQWLVHSSKTILQEAHHPRELHTTKSCDSITADLIERLISVQILKASERVPRYSGTDPDYMYFVRYDPVKSQHPSFWSMLLRRLWEPSDASFHAPTPEVNSEELIRCPTCPTCVQRSAFKQAHSQSLFNDQGLQVRGRIYHLYDCALVMSSAGICDIVQLVRIAPAHTGVIYFKRGQDVSVHLSQSHPIQQLIYM